jgi:predicted dehydrogenase
MWARAFLLLAAGIRDALRQGRTSVPGAATFEDGLRNQAVLDAVRASSRTGEWEPVRLPAARG